MKNNEEPIILTRVPTTFILFQLPRNQIFLEMDYRFYEFSTHGETELEKIYGDAVLKGLFYILNFKCVL